MAISNLLFSKPKILNGRSRTNSKLILLPILCRTQGQWAQSKYHRPYYFHTYTKKARLFFWSSKYIPILGSEKKKPFIEATYIRRVQGLFQPLLYLFHTNQDIVAWSCFYKHVLNYTSSIPNYKSFDFFNPNLTTRLFQKKLYQHSQI